MDLRVLLCMAFGLLALSSTVSGMCAVCTVQSYAACINQTAFYVCYDGQIASNQVIVCPEGQICTDEQGVCKPEGTAVPACVLVGCNECSGKIACVSQTQFAYCDANGVPGVIGSCQNGNFCNIDHFLSTQTICAPACSIWDRPPTCQNTEISTAAPPVDQWKTTCDGKTTKGYYKNIKDATCLTYVYCESLNGVMNAILYTCASGYFDQTTQKCGTTKPSSCT